VTVLIGLLFCAGRLLSGDAAEDAQKALQGDWQCVSGECGGQDDRRFKELKLTVEGDRMTFRWPTTTTTFAFTLDPSKEPKRLDRVCSEGRFKGEVCRGIYILDGDTLLLCSNTRGTDERPRAFQTAGNFAFTCLTFKRPRP
jgi:uncharacterized protein (TIGR03067 family)